MNVGLISLGCSKNRIDSEIMLHRLKKAGYKLVSSPDNADLVIINTCSFIDSAKEEAVDAIIEYGQRKELGILKYLIAAGCLVQRYGGSLLDEMPELDGVLGISYCDAVVDAVERIQSGERVAWCSPAPSEAAVQGKRILTTPPGMAYMRIADGCNNRCSYCAIPSIRGVFRSRPIEELTKEARSLVAKDNIQELVLIAQDTASYGIDKYGEPVLHELLGQLAAIDGLTWIRVMYLHPAHIDQKLIEALARTDHVIPYLDVPIQHASNAILRRMNRGHDIVQLRTLFAALKEKIDGLVLRTTVMTGFPGETGEDFKQLYDFLAETAFDWLGGFQYNPEEDTPAYAWTDEGVPPEIAAERLDAVLKLQRRITRGKNVSRIDTTQDILITERVAQGLYVGRGFYQAPEVDGVTMVKSTQTLEKGHFARVVLKAVKNYDMIGEIINEHS